MSKNSDADKAVEIAKHEMAYRVDLFNNMVASCHKKCIDERYKDAEMSVGETSCVDRCSHKYWQVTSIVGQLLGSNNV